jgi:DNA-binding GntR family transcriptional regulator
MEPLEPWERSGNPVAQERIRAGPISHTLCSMSSRPKRRQNPAAPLPSSPSGGQPEWSRLQASFGRGATYTEIVQQALSDLIVSLELPPGYRLIEAALAESFEMSKTPVREAIFGLVSDNLAVVEPHRGASVSWMSFAEFEEIIFVLNALQGPALPLVVESISDESLLETENGIEEMVAARAAADDKRYARAFYEHHAVLFGAAGYPKLLRTVNSINRTHLRYHRIFVTANADEWDMELDLIVRRFERIRERDAEGAAQLTQEFRAGHVERSRARLERDEGDIARYFVS